MANSISFHQNAPPGLDITQSCSTPPSLSTNHGKLAYLTTWQSLETSSSKISNFSPGSSPISIDTGASCYISNNKEDFINITPSTATLSGIAQGLPIHGTGTLQWTLLNYECKEVTLHIPNSMYIPSIPMNLLSPQHLAQETYKPTDGFQVHSSHGCLTFAGHKHTVLYNPTNNLPIFFTATNLDRQPLPAFPSSAPEMVQTYLASENAVTSTDTLSKLSQPMRTTPLSNLSPWQTTSSFHPCSFFQSYRCSPFTTWRLHFL